MTRRTGRRPGNPETREAILAAARAGFAERGYDNTSLRQIATGAGVDPALIHHYFGTKEKLFLEVVRPPIEPSEFLPTLLAGDPDKLGAHIVGAFISIWDGPETGPAFEALLRGAVSTAASARLMREFFATQVQRRLARELAALVPPDEVTLRLSLVASQLLGMALARYILKVEPLASAPREQVVALVAPTIQRYLREPL